MTRNVFEKYFYPENLKLASFTERVPVPPKTDSQTMTLSQCSIQGPVVYVCGRYRKLSRELCQSPWVLDGRRVMEDSVQEIIAQQVSPYFGTVDSKKIIFMSSGREDVDVRCLGNGRPFALEIVDSRKSVLPMSIAASMELAVEKSGKVSIQNLQLIER